jgi:hypothetical protein
MKRFLILAVLMAFGSLAAVAIAQTPFTDSRQAAGEQYGITAQGTVTVDPTAPPATTPPTDTATDDGSGVAGDTTSGEQDDDGTAGDSTTGDDGAQQGGRGTTAGRGSSGAAAAPGSVTRTAIGHVVFGGDSELAELLTSVLGLPGIEFNFNDLDESTITALAEGTEFAGIGGGDLDEEKLAALARELGADIVTAGPLAVRFAELLDTEGSVQPLTALVAGRNVDDLAPGKRTLVDEVLTGILRGALTEDIPVIGVEVTDKDPSNVPFFTKVEKLSIVDNVDTAVGQQSLKALVAGAKPGHYGTKKGADAEAAPTIDPDTSSAVVSGSGDGGGVSVVLVLGICGVALVLGRVAALRIRRRTPLT